MNWVWPLIFPVCVVLAGVLWELVPALITECRRREPDTDDWAFDENGQLLPHREAVEKKRRQLHDEGKL